MPFSGTLEAIAKVRSRSALGGDGIPGFYEILETGAEPEHPGQAAISEWLKGYDPDELDDFPIEVALGRIAARRNAAAKRIIKRAND